MTIVAHRWGWSDRVWDAGTKACVNSSVVVIGDPVRQEPSKMTLPKRDQLSQLSRSDTGSECPGA